MNINVNFYYDQKEARLVEFEITPGVGVSELQMYKDVQALATNFSTTLVEALQELIDAYNKPSVGPVQPVQPDPIPVPTPVEPPVEPKAPKKPVEEKPVEEKPVAMEDVRKALIEVRKTKGNDALRDCFSVVGAAKLPDVDPKDYAALLSAAKGALNAK